MKEVVMNKHSGNVTFYTVTWAADGNRYQSPVVLEEGYSTEADIPKMLAIKHLGSVDRAANVEIIDVDPQA
jgi:hypothetical protein